MSGLDARAAADLAGAYGTPLNVIDEDVIRAGVRDFQRSFEAHWTGPARVLPAIKASTVMEVLRIVAGEVEGCDLFSEGELEAAISAGFDPRQMSLNGNGKLADPDFLARAVRLGVRITIDDLGEVPAIEQAAADAGVVAEVRLRMRPSLANYWRPSQFLSPGVPTHLASQAYKAGMPLADLLVAGTRINRSPHLELTGLHMHLGRHRADGRFWEAAMQATAEIVRRCLAEWPGWQPRELDIGGGFAGPGDAVGSEPSMLGEAIALGALSWLPRPAAGVRDRLVGSVLAAMRRPAHEAGHGGGTRAVAPRTEDYARLVCRGLQRELGGVLDLREVTLEVEPGRAIFTGAGSHLTRVLGVKRQREPVPWTWVLTDTSTAFLLDGLSEYVRYPAAVPAREPTASRMVADLVGMSCTADRIIADLDLPAEVAVGDLVVIAGTGAYNEMGASNFNSLPRPATVIVGADGHRLARRRETISDVFARDVGTGPGSDRR